MKRLSSGMTPRSGSSSSLASPAHIVRSPSADKVAATPAPQPSATPVAPPSDEHQHGEEEKEKEKEKEKETIIVDFKKSDIAKRFPILLQKLSANEPWQRVVDHAIVALGDFIAIASDQLGSKSTDEETMKIKAEVKKIIEKFTAGKSIDPMMSHLEGMFN
jgi:hypothetical protein